MSFIFTDRRSAVKVTKLNITSQFSGSVPMDVGHLPFLARLSGTLPEDMRDPDVSEDSYRQSLKTFLFSQY